MHRPPPIFHDARKDGCDVVAESPGLLGESLRRHQILPRYSKVFSIPNKRAELMIKSPKLIEALCQYIFDPSYGNFTFSYT